MTPTRTVVRQRINSSSKMINQQVCGNCGGQIPYGCGRFILARGWFCGKTCFFSLAKRVGWKRNAVVREWYTK